MVRRSGEPHDRHSAWTFERGWNILRRAYAIASAADRAPQSLAGHMVPPDHELLRSRRLQECEALDTDTRIHAELLGALRRAGRLDAVSVVFDGVTIQAFGGEAAGPSLLDRSPKGTNHTLMVDRRGVPLAIRTAGANASDQQQIIPLVLGYPKVGGKPSRSEELPDDLFTDRG